MKKTTPILSTIFFSFLFIQVAHGEDDPRFESYNYKAVTEIKSQVTSLLTENQKLKQEQYFLKEQMNALMLILQDKRQQVKELVDKSGAFWLQEENKSFDEALDGKFLGLEKDLESQQVRVNYMNTEIMDLNERFRLWKLYLADLEYQKREIELDLKLKEAKALENNRDRSGDISQIRKDIMTTREKHLRLRAEIDRLQNSASGILVQAKKLMVENKNLEQKNTVHERRVDIRYSENQLLRDKIAYTKKLKEVPVLDQIKEKNVLQAEVAELEKEYEKLSKDLMASMNKQQLERKIINNVMAIDKANQGLKQKITTLQKEIESTPETIEK